MGETPQDRRFHNLTNTGRFQ